MSKIALRLVGPTLLALFALGVALEGTVVEAVLVELLPGAQEPRDGGVLGLGSSKPDYRLDLEIGSRWVEGETLENTPIGDGLRFELARPTPRSRVTQLRLVEDDAVRDDVLEELPLEDDQVEGQAYRFTLETGWSFGAGIERFMGTPLGVLLALGLSIAIVAGAGWLALRRATEG